MKAIEEKFFLKLVKRFDWTLFIVSMLLTLIGILFIYSATLPTGKAGYYCGKQLLAFGLGSVLMFILVLFPYTFFRSHIYGLFIFSVGLLLGLFFFGKVVRGTRAWYDLGLFYFQPTELAKIFYILILAGYLEKEERNLGEINYLLLPFFFTFVYLVLILAQPDFSSSLVFLPLLLVMLYLAGVKFSVLGSLLFYFIFTFVLVLFNSYLSLLKEENVFFTFFESVMDNYRSGIVFLIGIFLLLAFAYWFIKKLKFPIRRKHFFISYALLVSSFLSVRILSLLIKPYQRGRLLSFLAPSLDPLGAGYNVFQSKVAIGSGRIFGKGLFSSTQGRLGFLPERHTDFIFSLISEEVGFLGSVLILILFLVLIYRCLSIVQESRDRFGSFVAGGITTLFVFNCFINIGMSIGVMPAVGLPLPFLSYGGSHLVSVYFAIGLLLSIHLRRFVH